MATLYSDPAAMRRLAASMDAEAATLRSRLRGLASDLEATWWQGPDADRFRAAWSSEHSRHLSTSIRRLTEAAAQLRAEATAQERTSHA